MNLTEVLSYVDNSAELLNVVDGALLSIIDDQMLISDFAMSRFEAKKLIMFVKEGWRPKSDYDR